MRSAGGSLRLTCAERVRHSASIPAAISRRPSWRIERGSFPWVNLHQCLPTTRVDHRGRRRKIPGKRVRARFGRSIPQEVLLSKRGVWDPSGAILPFRSGKEQIARSSWFWSRGDSVVFHPPCRCGRGQGVTSSSGAKPC